MEVAMSPFFRLYFPHPKKSGCYIMKDFQSPTAARAWVSVTLPGVHDPGAFIEAYGFIIEG
jgi:hypothetical protein